MDRVLEAMALTVYDLVPSDFGSRAPEMTLFGNERIYRIPVVSPRTAMGSPFITPAVTDALIPIPAEALEDLRPANRIPGHRNWQRLVAVRRFSVRYPSFVLDRQYHSLDPYLRSRLNIFGVHSRNDALTFGYVRVDSLRAILRPHALTYPLELLEIDNGASPSTIIVERVCVCISELSLSLRRHANFDSIAFGGYSWNKQ